MHPGRGISVVVPHYGPVEMTGSLVDALLTQTERPIEVIVVDDCSPQPFPERAGVILVRRERNGGFGAAVNSGAERARGDLLLILNSDVEIESDFIQRLSEAAEPWLPAVCGPLLRNGLGGFEITGRHFPTARAQGVEWLSGLARFRDHRLLHEAIGNDTRCRPGATVSVDWLGGAALLLPLATFRQVGGFDTGFYMNCEEVDLQRRLRDLGIPSVFLGAVSAIHRGAGSSDPSQRRAWTAASRHRYARKWDSPARLHSTLAAATAVNAVTNGVRQLAGRDVDALAVAREEWHLAVGDQR